MITLVDSITDFDRLAMGGVVVTGSHCGAGIASCLAGARVSGLLGNDAGGGREGAGFVALAVLDRHGIAAATISSHSARIGLARDTLDRGVVSEINGMAMKAGLHIGMAARQAAARLARRPAAILPAELGRQMRTERVLGGVPVVLVDSASAVGEADAGKIVITGSHGGLVGGNPARGLKARAALAVFNDAGIGLERAGIARLDALDRQGIPGAAVHAASARIGSAISTYDQGVLSVANEAAKALGASVGMPVRDLVAQLIGR